jgi:hypothetical protein
MQGRKPILLLANLVFFVGSLTAALANSIGMLIVARAIQGIGGGGLLTLVNISIGDLFSMRYGYPAKNAQTNEMSNMIQNSRYVLRNRGLCMGSRERDWSIIGRSFYTKSLLAMVSTCLERRFQDANIGSKGAFISTCHSKELLLSSSCSSSRYTRQKLPLVVD